MSRLARLVVVFASVAVALATLFLSSGEIITARALATIPLYDPSRGLKLKTVGTLAPGETLQVVGCHDRKSDIDIQVSFQGQTAVLGGKHGEFQLRRRSAYLWEPYATNTCHGFFTASSVAS